MTIERNKAVGVSLIVLGVSAIVSALVANNNFSSSSKQLISPLAIFSPSSKSKLISSAENQKVIFGFLPYWNIKYEPSINYSQLTHLAFFGLDIDKNGNIKTRVNPGEAEPGWTAYRSPVFGSIVRKAHDANVRVIMVLRAFDNETIESIVASKTKQEKLIENTLTIVKQKNLDGINIDFEYVGAPPQKIRDQFTGFVKEFHNRCSLFLASCSLSVDTYADAATSTRIWDLAALGPLVDHIIVMAYDFTRPSSDYSGPVAPLDQIKQAIAEYSKQIPLQKLLLGVPYYGYEWPTYSPEPMSKTINNGYIATYKRVIESILKGDVNFGWDIESFTPYIISTESGKTTQIFYDDVRSLGLKYDFVNETGLGGIAIWALGYDHDRPELWQLLKEKFKP